MFGYPFFRQQQQSPRYYAPSQNPQKRLVQDEFGNVYLVPESTYYPRNIDPEEHYYPQHHHHQQHFNPIYEEEENEEDDDEPTQFKNDYHHHRLVSTPHKQNQKQRQKQQQKQQSQPTRIPINTNSHSQQPQPSSQPQQQPTTKVTHKQKETKTYTLAEQTNAAVAIQKVFRGRRVRRDSPITKLSTLCSTQKTANELFLQADNENILEEGHIFESNTACVGNVPKALAQLDHELTKLLLVLDGVGSGFSEEVQSIVRSKRKEVAQNIELMLTAVDVAKRTCVIRPLEQPKYTTANSNTSTDTTTTTTPSDSLVDVEMQSVDCENNNTPTETQTQSTSNTLSLSSETTITTPQTTSDIPSSEPSHNQSFDVDPIIEDITELIDQRDEKNETNISDSEDWVVLPSDSAAMEIATTTPSATKPPHFTIPSLKNLSYNACDQIIKSALLRTPVAC